MSHDELTRAPDASAEAHFPKRTCQTHVAKRTWIWRVPTLPNGDYVIIISWMTRLKPNAKVLWHTVASIV